ncbi:MAG: hypothetical protein WC949_04455 [Candidatus Paceibacterota bacterium]|jgi:hypothetical protein
MNKKIKIIVAAIFAIVLAGGIGTWWWNNKDNPVQGRVSDYKIGGSSVTNSRAGVSYVVPQGWKAEKVDYSEGSVIFYKEGTNVEKNNDGSVKLPVGEGCLIEVGVAYKDYDLDSIRLEALSYRNVIEGATSSLESTSVNNISAIKQILEAPSVGKVNIVHTPKNGKVYNFTVYLPTDQNNQPSCSEDFGKFLETVSIK